MKKNWMTLSALMLAVASAAPAWAQQTSPAADDFKPASTNIVGQQYPQVNSARQVRFRINAPQVQTIRVMGTNLVKDENGVFTGTTAPQDPGFHAYQLTVDGLVVADPASESFFSGGKMTSSIEVPDKGVDFYDLKDVPHGEILSHWYKGKSGDNRQAWVYTPRAMTRIPPSATRSSTCSTACWRTAACGRSRAASTSSSTISLRTKRPCP